MELKSKSTPAGLKLFLNAKHVKTIPNKYADVFLEVMYDFDKKRMNKDEEIYLKSALAVYNFEQNLAKNEKYIHELICDSYPKFTQPVQTKDELRHEIVYENGVRVRCCQFLYETFHTRMDIKYSNY